MMESEKKILRICLEMIEGKKKMSDCVTHCVNHEFNFKATQN